jgi:RNA polymerase sigma factor (sigma-70 family)
MDRDKRWGRVKDAYDLLVEGKGAAFESAQAGIQASYDADAGIAAVERLQEIDEAMARLGPRERELLMKKHMEGYTADEIAQATGISKPSVKSMISMARKKLMKELQNILQT